MTNPTTKKASSKSDRTRIITGLSIAGVAIASLFAVGANLGILNKADETSVGTVSAAGEMTPVDTRVVDVYLDKQVVGSSPAAGLPPGAETFSVDQAGTVTVSATNGQAKLDAISPESGWNAKAVQVTGADLAVSFSDGTHDLEFVATVGPDGQITGDVTDATGVGQTATLIDDHDSHEQSEHDGDKHKTDKHDDDHKDHHHEGGDSDD